MSIVFNQRERYEGFSSILVADASAPYAGTYSSTNTTSCVNFVLSEFTGFRGLGTYVQSTSTGTSTTGVTSIAIAFPGTNVAGNSIIAVIGGGAPGFGPATVTCGDSKANSYTGLTHVGAVFGLPQMNVFYASGIHAGTNTCTFTITGAGGGFSSWLNDPQVSILEYSGSAILDGDTNGASSTGGILTTTLTSQYNNETLLTFNFVDPTCAGYPIIQPSSAPSFQRGNIDYDQIRRSVRSGPGGTFAMVTGSTTQGNGVVTDSLGNLIDGGTPFSSPLTTKGDLFTWGNTNTRLPVGTQGQVLTVNTGGADGIDWETPAFKSLTTSNTSGAATLSTLGVLNIPQYATGFSNPMTTLGDIILGTTGGTAQRLGIGTQGQVLTVSTASNDSIAWQTPSTGFTNPMTTKGDVIIGTTGGTPDRLAVGSNGKVLTANSGATDGADWEAPLALTTTGTSGAASLTPGNPYTLNVPQYSGGGGGPNKVVVYTSPVLGSLTWVNQGSATASTNADNSVTIINPNSADAIKALVQAVPGSTPYSIYAAFALFANVGNGGLIITDGTKFVTFNRNTNAPSGQFEVQRWSTSGTFSATSYSVSHMIFSPVIYLRITNDGTNLNYYVSPDAFNWQLLFSEAKGAFLGTITSYGFFADNATASYATIVQCLSLSTSAFTAS